MPFLNVRLRHFPKEFIIGKWTQVKNLNIISASFTFLSIYLTTKGANVCPLKSQLLGPGAMQICGICTVGSEIIADWLYWMFGWEVAQVAQC